MRNVRIISPEEALAINKDILIMEELMEYFNMAVSQKCFMPTSGIAKEDDYFIINVDKYHKQFSKSEAIEKVVELIKEAGYEVRHGIRHYGGMYYSISIRTDDFAPSVVKEWYKVD